MINKPLRATKAVNGPQVYNSNKYPATKSSYED
jgi:hypothetical protein